MPTAAARNCTRPGCNGVIRNGVCNQHGVLRRGKDRGYDKQRGSSHERGYGATWRKLRLMVLASNPLCVDCQRNGLVVIATEVDHIMPKAHGGEDLVDNLQPLCQSCHSRKTRKEQRMATKFEHSRIPVTIVAGAPGSGKTTFVQEHMLWGDLVVDIDGLFVALSGLAWYDKPLNLLPFVLEARDAVLHRLARESEVRRAWVITGEADVEKLRGLKQQLGADTLLVMDVTQGECYKRIAHDQRRNDKVEQQKELVARWFEKYNAKERVG